MAVKINKFLTLRLVISLVLIALIVRVIDLSILQTLFYSIKLRFFFLALCLVTVERFLLAYKWNVLLAVKRISLPFLEILKISYVSNFIGTFLPSSVGSDLCRVYGLYSSNSNLAEAVSSVFLERMIALVALLMMAMVGVIFFAIKLREWPMIAGVWVVIILLFGLCIVVLRRNLWDLFIGGMRLFGLDIEDKRRRFEDAFSGYTADRMALIRVLFLSLLFQVVRVLETYSVGLSLKGDISIVYFFFFVPLIMVLLMLPISVGGLGVREGAYVYFFSQVGMSTVEAFTLALLFYGLVIISIIPGGIIFLFEGLGKGFQEGQRSRL